MLLRVSRGGEALRPHPDGPSVFCLLQHQHGAHMHILMYTRVQTLAPGDGQNLCLLLSHTNTNGLLIMWVRRLVAHTLSGNIVY